MPGTYAHITLANLVAGKAVNGGISGFPKEAERSLMKHLKFVEMGANSPDYPYLAVGDKKAAMWADRMHYETPGRMIQVGIEMVASMSGDEQRKCTAWLLGYAAHVTTDVVIHPVINKKVGPYAENKTAHRVCEMNQDVYIFQRLNLGGVDLAEHLSSGIGECSGASKKKLDAQVAKLWKAILKVVHPAAYKTSLPDVDKWHAWFNLLVDGIAEEGNRLFPLARHVAAKSGVVYPLLSEIRREFIDSLETPTGAMSYDAIFDKAQGHVADVWSVIAKGIFEKDIQYQAVIGDWNLDTGLDPNGKLVFWS